MAKSKIGFVPLLDEEYDEVDQDDLHEQLPEELVEYVRSIEMLID